MWPNPKLRRSTRVKAGRYAPTLRPIHDPSIITILVGPEELPFRIHEKYAAQLRMFAAALREQFWAEARTRVMRLPETSTTLFEIFVQGLYHKRLFSDNRELDQELRLKFGALASREGDHQYKGFLAKSPETWPWRVLVSLYVLADYLDAQVVRIAAVDAMILRHEKSDLMTFDDIDFAFANTSPDSKLRELLVRITTYDLDMGNTAREDLIGMPNEFLVDVSMTLSRRLPNRQCQSCYQSALSWVQQADAVPARFHEPQDGPPWQTLNIATTMSTLQRKRRETVPQESQEKRFWRDASRTETAARSGCSTLVHDRALDNIYLVTSLLAWRLAQKMRRGFH